jgi:cholesterol transport system auxiliary component
MNCGRSLLAVSIIVVLSACSIGRTIPQATTYVVDPPAGVTSPSVGRRPETLRVGFVRVAAAYAGNALVYRLDDVRYASDPYHALIADPGAMLGSRVTEWLEHAGPFSAVAAPGTAQPASFVLEATVNEMYGDFRQGRSPAAVMSVQFALIDQASARPKVRYERTISSRVNLPKASPDALVRGYGIALAEILSQIAPDLRASIVP